MTTYVLHIVNDGILLHPQEHQVVHIRKQINKRDVNHNLHICISFVFYIMKYMAESKCLFRMSLSFDILHGDIASISSCEEAEPYTWFDSNDVLQFDVRHEGLGRR